MPSSVKIINPLVPDAHYSERWDRLASLQNRLLEDNLDDKLADFYILLLRNWWVNVAYPHQYPLWKMLKAAFLIIQSDWKKTQMPSQEQLE